MNDEMNSNESVLDDKALGQSHSGASVSKIDDYKFTKVKKLADSVQAGDDAINKLRVQNLDFILDIPLKLTVELGRTSLAIKDLLQLGQGSVLELDKLAGEPLEILVNGKLIAKGEVVVVNEKFGIRITDIVSPVERIETLR